MFALAGRSHDIGRTIEDTGVCDVNKNALVVAEDVGVKGFASLLVYVWRESFGTEDVIDSIGASGVGGFFAVDTMAIRLDISQAPFLEYLGHIVKV
jgi:hypothetical protein